MVDVVKFDELKPVGEKWAAEFCKALNESPEYEEAGKGWGVEFDGGMLFVMEACGEIEDDLQAFLDLKDGKCLGIRVLAPGEAPPREPALTVTAPFLTWRKIATHEVGPVQAIMQGLLGLKGDMGLAMRYSRAAVELANAVDQTDTTIFTKYDLGD
ncbi:MAG: SCP2 sterol-binding domain-containing protein [Promethearchaeota archaeon]